MLNRTLKLLCLLSLLIALSLFSCSGTGDDDDTESNTPANQGDDDTVTGDDDTNSAGDDDTVTGDDDTGTSGDDDTSTAGDDDTSANGDDDTTDPGQDLSSIPVNGATMLDITNPFGSISVTGDTGRSDVSIDVAYSGGNPLDYDKISVTVADDSPTITVLVSESELVEGAEVALTVSTPASLPLTAETGSGAVTFANMNAPVWVVTTEGAITGGPHTGNVGITSTSGDVSLDVTMNAGGSVDVGLASGQIDLTIPSDTSATLTATTSSGTITINNITLAGMNTGMAATGSFGAGDGSIELVTGSGNINISGT